ncbi:MAG: glucosamine-6-phosphate isomerase [Proteobacteria bacterium]|nr:glucosamine-6-phosphate isomerase [Pseudomonadota bacterium]MBI3499924.1 glucosamine-6-phosphate isomerase [Pseudomonadota bacterium]
MDLATRTALAMPKEKLGQGSSIGLRVVATADQVIQAFADALFSEYRAAKQAGRDKVVFIVPVGPVGQYDRFAKRCNDERQSLADLVIINMDEYLTPDGKALIPTDDPLSFRRHMQDHFYGLIEPTLSPPASQCVWPDPKEPAAIGRMIEGLGGVDVCFAGVGINGHIAFNDPPEPGESIQLEDFARLSTRVVKLSRETRLINAINACRGNVDRLPPLAVTVGMREILASRKLRLYMRRDYQAAILRRMLHGPVSAAVPASLVQRHQDAEVTAASYVTDVPEPTLS